MNPAALEPVPLSPDLAPPAAAAPAGDGRRAADPADAPPAGIGAVEWRQRVDLAAVEGHLDEAGRGDLAEHPAVGVDQEVVFRTGHARRDVGEDQIVPAVQRHQSVAGSQVDAGPHEINPAGFMIHSAIHAAREDAVCVLHVHSVNGVAVSAQEEGLLPLSQHSMFVLASLGTHDYEGVALESDEKPRLVHDLGANRFLMLRNHGLLTVGRSVAEAFVAMYFFETACMMQVRAQAGGGRLRRIGEPILRGAQAQWERVTQGAGGGLAWPALLRRLDAIDPGYRR